MDSDNTNQPTGTPVVSQDNPQPNIQYVQQPVTSQSDSSKTLIPIILILLAVLVAIVCYSLGSGKFSLSSRVDPELDALRAQRASLGTSGSNLSAEGLAVRISEDANDLSFLLNQYSTSLSDKQKQAENLDAINDSLHDQVSDLKSRLSELNVDAAQKGKLENELNSLRQLYDASSASIDEYRRRLAQVPSDDEFQRLQRDNEQLRSQIISAPSQNELVRLEQENQRLRQQLAELKAKTNRSRLFADSADLLSAKGQRLYRRLSGLEGRSNSERLAVYENIRQELNARVVETVSFGSGVSSVNDEKGAVIRQALQSTGSTSEYLIVGYASHSGDASINRELSAKRATSVAGITDLQRGATQAVKAVFLGQTDRFSTTNEFANQICEIWEIIPE